MMTYKKRICYTDGSYTEYNVDESEIIKIREKFNRKLNEIPQEELMKFLEGGSEQNEYNNR